MEVLPVSKYNKYLMDNKGGRTAGKEGEGGWFRGGRKGPERVGGGKG